MAMLSISISNPSPPRTYYLGTGALKGPLGAYYLGTWGAREKHLSRNYTGTVLPKCSAGGFLMPRKGNLPEGRWSSEFPGLKVPQRVSDPQEPLSVWFLEPEASDIGSSDPLSLNPKGPKLPLLGGSWDLVTTYIWAYKPPCNIHNCPYGGYPNCKSGSKPSHK